MALVQPGTVGILPAGALGVAFYFHLTRELRAGDERVRFLPRAGSGRRGPECLRIVHGDETRAIALPASGQPHLVAGAEAGFLPEVLLVCTQPDRLLGIMSEVVRLLEFFQRSGQFDAAASALPIVVLSSNGIYFQRVRQFLLEKLEEATLFGRLPDLWPETMPRLVGKLLRGVTIQTGQRAGFGPEAIYRPGPSGRTLLAGGDPAQRARCAALLTERGGWFEDAGLASPTRVEFDKALINLTVNLLGQLRAIDAHGNFRALSIGEIFAQAAPGETRELARQVVEVGRAVRAYGEGDDFEMIYARMQASAGAHLEHVPSSLQWIDQQLRLGCFEPHLTPTEKWLLEPLIRYAHAAGLEAAAHYFADLTRRVELRLASIKSARA